MKNRTRLVAAAALSVAAGAALAFSGTSTFALWSSDATTAPQTLAAARSLVTVDNATFWTLPASVLQNVTPDAPQAVPIDVTGLSQGNPGLRYSMTEANTGGGTTGLVTALQAEITPVASDAACTTAPAAPGYAIYTGSFLGAQILGRQIVAPGPSQTTGTETLCLRVSLPNGYGDYVNHATVTMDSDSGGTVSASTEWHGTATPAPSDRTLGIRFSFTSQTFRPGA